jgi:hypothetical protein
MNIGIMDKLAVGLRVAGHAAMKRADYLPTTVREL